MPMRVQVILNPAADRGRARRWRQTIINWGAGLGQIDLRLSQRPGQGVELACQAAAEGYDVVAAAGGDGTVHEVVNGLVQAGRPEVRLGLIPIGSGNDFAYGLGLLSEVPAAVTRLFAGTARPIDLARIEDDRGQSRVVDNAIGIGFDATINVESRQITRLHGFAAYALATLRTIAFYYATPHFQAQFDQEQVSQKGLLLAVGLGPRVGGGFLLTPQARHDDGLLDSCLVDPMGRLRMLALLPRVMRGTHVTVPQVTMRQSRRIVVSSDLPMPIHVDGEIYAFPQDNVHRVTISSMPAALQVAG